MTSSTFEQPEVGQFRPVRRAKFRTKSRGPVRPPLTEAQQRLAEKYLPLARKMAKPLKLNFPSSFDEFESAACFALVEAAQSFDPDRNVRFSTFARFRIRGALCDVQRALIAKGWDREVDQAPALGGLFEKALARGYVLGIQPEVPVGAELEAADSVDRWLKKLPPKHAAACRHIYVEGYNQNEAARIMGCSKTRISYLHKESLAMLEGSWNDRVRVNKMANASA